MRWQLKKIGTAFNQKAMQSPRIASTVIDKVSAVRKPAIASTRIRKGTKTMAISHPQHQPTTASMPEASTIYAKRREACGGAKVERRGTLAQRLDPVAIYARRKAAMTRFRTGLSAEAN